MPQPHFDTLLAKIADKTAAVGIIGLGYVGLPLGVTAAKRGLHVTGFDVDAGKIVKLEVAQSYIEAVDSAYLARLKAAGSVTWTPDFPVWPRWISS